MQFFRNQAREILDLKTDAIKKEFDINNREGAFSLFCESLKNDSDGIKEQFDMNVEHSAFSKLKRDLEKHREKVSGNLDLNNKDSAIFKMNEGLKKAIKEIEQGQTTLLTEVRELIAKQSGKKEESQKSTTYGKAYEEKVLEHLEHICVESSDICEAVGTTRGINGKQGDVLVTINQDHRAGGIKIIYEAKTDKTFTSIKKCLDEMKGARKNRDADYGVMVMPKNAPLANSIDLFQRHGNDLLVVWDEEEPQDDYALKISLLILKAIALKEMMKENKGDFDYDLCTRDINEIKDNIDKLADIVRLSSTIKNNSTRIIETAEKMEVETNNKIQSILKNLKSLRLEFDKS